MQEQFGISIQKSRFFALQHWGGGSDDVVVVAAGDDDDDDDEPEN